MGKQLEAQLLEEKLKKLQIGGQETFLKMLAPNWEDDDLETNPIINYFVDRNHIELILERLKINLKSSAFTVINVKTAKHLTNV